MSVSVGRTQNGRVGTQMRGREARCPALKACPARRTFSRCLACKFSAYPFSVPARPDQKLKPDPLDYVLEPPSTSTRTAVSDPTR